MNHTSDRSVSGTTYEYTVREQPSRTLLFKRITLVALYVLWAIAWLWAGIVSKQIVPLFVFTPISLWILIFFTWRLTQIEYEFSFFAGNVTVSCILGGRTRRAVCELRLRDIERVLPCDIEDINAQIERFAPQVTHFAASGEDSPHLFAALYRDEDGTPSTLYLELNEQAKRIIRSYNPTAIPTKYFDFDKQTKKGELI